MLKEIKSKYKALPTREKVTVPAGLAGIFIINAPILTAAALWYIYRKEAKPLYEKAKTILSLIK